MTNDQDEMNLVINLGITNDESIKVGKYNLVLLDKFY